MHNFVYKLVSVKSSSRVSIIDPYAQIYFPTDIPRTIITITVKEIQY